jgi:hydrogenase-4 component F
VIALALGFLGLLHALMEGVVGDESRHRRRRRSREERPTIALTAVLGTGMLACGFAGLLLLPGSGFVDTLARGAL